VPHLIALLAASVAVLSGAQVVHAQGAWPSIALTPVVNGFSQPTHVTHAGDGSGRLFVAQRNGRVFIVRDGQRASTPFLDISSRVGEALLSIAFPPGYGTGGRKAKTAFYVNYIDKGLNVVIARYHVGVAGADVADSTREEIVLRIPPPAAQPPRTGAGHAGGELAFGPDGYLYVGIGDAGNGGEGDPFNLAQDPGSLRGKILRLDVEAKKPYRIPSTNPFVRQRGWRGEIWALGVRNPFRSSFDRQTGDFYVADVGEARYEEVNVQPAGVGGQNYGWKIMEGTACFSPASGCNQAGLTVPAHVYAHDADHAVLCSVTGGRVYRGSAYPALRGIYIFGDLCIGKIFGLRRTTTGAWESQLLHDPEVEPPSFANWGLVTFGDDEAGNIYAAHYWTGQIYRIVTP
jgi:glucose/arabinose dehydrogenase